MKNADTEPNNGSEVRMEGQGQKAMKEAKPLRREPKKS